NSLPHYYNPAELRQGGSGGSAGPQEAYRQQCDRLKAALARVCLLQLSDARVRLCFYYPHDRQAAAFLKALRLNPNLLELNLKDNGFDSKAKLTRLSRLLEDHGTIGRLTYRRAFATLHSALSQGASLVSMKLSRCGLADSDGALLGSFLTRDKHLEHLDISGNNLGPQTATALAQALRVNAYLIDLDLSWNTFNSACFATLASGLAANSELRRLNCSCNGAEDRGLAALLKAATADASRLRVLELDNCRVTHLSTPELLQCLRRQPGRLHAVKLNRNLFREADVLQLLAAVAALPESQLALLEVNNVPRTQSITEATPAGLRVTLRLEKEVKVRMVNADSLA
uniref:Si:dkey-288a3.2 n=1 Tax=Macrostomum lignano TaxID=282301 RepID=A0A1I8HUW5_9PLAT